MQRQSLQRMLLRMNVLIETGQFLCILTLWIILLTLEAEITYGL